MSAPTSPRRALLRCALPALTALALLAPTAAHAQSFSFKDARGDVVGFAFDEPLQEPDISEEPVPVPRNKSADVVRTKIEHRGGNLTTTLTLREARAKNQVFATITVRAGRTTYDVTIGRMGRQGDFAEMMRKDKPVECDGLRHQLRAGSKQLVVTVPRSCLGNPGQVRVGVVMGAFDRRHGIVFDDALRKGVKRKQAFTKRLRHN